MSEGLLPALALLQEGSAGTTSGRELIVQLSYLAASVLFILGLRALTRPDQARLGMQQAAAGMLLAVVGALLHQGILTYSWILAGLAIGAAFGYPMAMKVPMTAMPQFIAFSHAFGAIAATLVGVVEYQHLTGASDGSAPTITRALGAALGFEVLFGALTITGSFMAFGKLQELITGRPITFKGQNVFNGLIALGAIGAFVVLIVAPETSWAFYTIVGLALFLGISLVLPIGGGDMPVVISLLNSYAGLAASATGFAIGNNVLIIAGALEGAGGFILSILMSKAMNRSFANVLFGAFGSAQTASAGRSSEGLTVKSITAEDAAVQLAFAKLVIVIPGYGLAVAQAQHQVRELAELIEKKGGEVKFAIHPVAGRMPGHMNVLLAEANLPYEKLLDMEEINHEFPNADVALVIGANDVVNPAARHDTASPIYGMPILDADRAKSVIVMKRSMAAGFAGIENELFYDARCSMLFGDAKKSLSTLITEVKAL
ncbi:MAG: NAD(P) transhydrogenase subunit beta [Gemmatimonadaceae bacterium]|nr:NAD(P) transhydrogenase subunit beta [Gemmatimonadaceae bacterium]